MLIGYHDGRTFVLKAGATGDARVRIEIDALSRAAGEHVVALEDVAADERNTVLVLERLPNGTLAELLERRTALDPGEAVTILAPLAVTLDRIHTAGVAHGALTLSSVCFRDDGAPTLVGFGAAELFAPAAPEVVRETVPSVRADRVALAELAALVLGRVGGAGAAGARHLATTVADVSPEELANALFAVATPAPVRFGESDADADAVAVRVGEPREPGPDTPTPPTVLPLWIANLLPDALRDRVAEPAARLTGIWAGWEPRRRRLAVGITVAAVAVTLALIAVPPSSSPLSSSPPGSSQPGAAAPSASPTMTGFAPALPDDPLAAAEMLLDRREECLRDLSVLCLDDVVQPGSAALADDAALIRAVREGSGYPDGTVLTGTPVLVERLGDSALIDLPEGSEPASLLLMRTEAGWRIRDYLEAAPAIRSRDSRRSRRSRGEP